MKSSVSLSLKKVQQQGGLVVLPLAEYRKLLERAVPTYYLSGKAAEQLDRRVDRALREYRAGKTIQADSLTEAMAIYGKRRKR